MAVAEERRDSREVVEVDVTEAAGPVAVCRPEEGALDGEDLDVGQPRLGGEDLRAGVREVGEQRSAHDLADLPAGLADAAQLVGGHGGILGAEAAAEPVDPAAERVHPVRGAEERDLEARSYGELVARLDAAHLDVVGRAAFEPGREIEEGGDLGCLRGGGVGAAAGDALQLALAGPERQPEQVVEVRVGDDDVLHRHQGPGRSAGVQGEAELGEEEQRALAGPRAADEAKLAPGRGEDKLTHARSVPVARCIVNLTGAASSPEGMAMAARREWPVRADDEHELVGEARRGDRDAAEKLLVRHELLVFRVCRNMLPRGEDIEAAVQETFVRALRGLPKFSGESSFASWLVAIALNLCRDRLRRHRLVPFVPLEHDEEDVAGPIDVVPSSAPDPERVAMARQAIGLVREELGKLPGRQREVFALRFFAGLDLEGIARVLGVDVGTVKTHLHRGVQRIRRVAEEALP